VSVGKISRVGGLSCVAVAVAAGTLGAAGARASGCPNEPLRAQQRSAYLPDCRAFELVTPASKAGIALALPLISTDGEHLIAGGLGIFAGAEQNTGGAIGSETGGIGAFYEFARGEAAWATKPVAPPPSTQFPAAGMQSDASPALSTTLWKLQASSQQRGEGDLYRREANGSFVRVGALQPPGERPRFGNEGVYRGSSHDLRRVLITKEPRQGRWPGDTTSGQNSLYEYGSGEAAEPMLVGVSNSGPLKSNTEAALISACETELGSSADKYNAISGSGAIVFFTARACGSSPSADELYARVEGTHTVPISEPTLPSGACTGVCLTAEHKEGIFQGASEDGTKAFFMTEQPLMDLDKDSTSDLYQADISGAGLGGLTMVSRGETLGAPSENDPTPGEGARVDGVLRVSEDGSHVYFAAKGVLTRAANGQGDTAQAGAENLYVYNAASGRTGFVARLSEEDGELWRRQDNGRPVAATPDGRFLVLVSRADLTGEGGVGGAQVYEYDAQSGVTRRVSLGQHSSSEALSPRIVESSYEREDLPSQAHSTLTVSDDGAYVFFESPDALTPQALDDQVVACVFEFAGHCFNSAYAQNIYSYHAGQVSLITTVRDTSGQRTQRLIGTDAAGTDVFFTTADPLLTQDTDTQVDIYDARIDGGFPPLITLAGCSGDACQGPLGATPVLSAAGSATQAGGDNVPPPVSKPTKKGHRHKHRARHRKMKRTGRRAKGSRGGHSS